MLAEYLYQLTPRDLQAAMLELLNVSISDTQIAATVDASYVVPLEHVLILKAATLYASPGAGQAVIGGQIGIREKNGVYATLKAMTATTAATGAAGIVAVTLITNATPCAVSWSGEIFVGPESQIIGRSSFNIGVGPNGSTLSIFGLLIPRGNIAL